MKLIKIISEIKQVVPIYLKKAEHDGEFSFNIEGEDYRFVYHPWIKLYITSFNTDVGDGFRRYGKLKRYLDLKKIQHDESESRYSCSIKIPEYCVKIIE
jgi:hypothetical protein